MIAVVILLCVLENVAVMETRNQMLEYSSFCDMESVTVCQSNFK